MRGSYGERVGAAGGWASWVLPAVWSERSIQTVPCPPADGEMAEWGCRGLSEGKPAGEPNVGGVLPAR